MIPMLFQFVANFQRVMSCDVLPNVCTLFQSLVFLLIFGWLRKYSFNEILSLAVKCALQLLLIYFWYGAVMNLL